MRFTVRLFLFLRIFFFLDSCQSILPRISEFSNVELKIFELSITEARNEMWKLQSDNLTLASSTQSKDFSHSFVKFQVPEMLLRMESNIYLKTFEILVKRKNIPRTRALGLLKNSLKTNHPLSFSTSENDIKLLSCGSENEIYRTIDGSCNNIANPNWGAASSTPFLRLLPADYENYISEPRGGLIANKLPNVRLISVKLHPDLIRPDASITNIVVTLGQLLTHDLSITPFGEGTNCCIPSENQSDCWPIDIGDDDPFFSNLGQTCMSFTRSMAFTFPTKSGVREQFNAQTAYTDLSPMYGFNEKRATQLRAFIGGLMHVKDEESQFLPTTEQILKNESDTFTGKYISGDPRVNQIPELTALHTLFLREHNRIAKIIQKLRPEMTDEIIYEETRRIVIAEWQNIVYGEYLPVILGAATMNKYGISLKNEFSSYDDKIDATIYNSFTAASFRFGHTLINGLVHLYKGLKKVNSYELKNNYFESEQLDQNNGEGYELILRGLMIQNAQSSDRFVSEDVTNHVNKIRGRAFGGDLTAFDIQRGRDHGVRAYNDYRKLCNLTALGNWDKKPKEIPSQTWMKMQSLYVSPLDIDLFSGGMSELPIRGSITGPTLNCLLALQFRNTKIGDRFFFTHKNQAGSFTLKQIRDIRKRTLGDIICENSKLENTPANVFLTVSSKNQLIPCDSNKRNSLPVNRLLKV